MLSTHYATPQILAVLPLSNQSTDIDAPGYIRQEFIKHLSHRGYQIQDTARTDEILKSKFGVNEGGQLNSTTPQKLCKGLGVDAVVYGEIEDFKYLNVGFYTNKSVAATFKMINGNGEQLWEDQRKASRKQVALSMDDAKRKLAAGLVDKIVGKMLKVPLYEEVQRVVRVAVSTLPRAK